VFFFLVSEGTYRGAGQMSCRCPWEEEVADRGEPAIAIGVVEVRCDR